MRRAEPAAAFAALLACMLVTHNVGDHAVQTDAQAASKAAETGWGPGMAGHVGGYHVTQLLGLLPLRALGVRPSWRRLALGVAFSAATHAFLDRRWPVRWLLEHTGSARFARPPVLAADTLRVQRVLMTGEYGTVPVVHLPERPVPMAGGYLTDQALHHLCLAIAALIMAGGRR